MRHDGNLSCVLRGAGNVRFEDRPIPEIKDPYDVIARVCYVGVCGSDVHQWTHGGSGPKEISEAKPMVMGHEASGIVEAVGSAVTRVKPGDRITIEPGLPCRRCKQCKSGRYNTCPSMRFAADPPTDGNLARFYKVEEDFVYAIPDDLSLEEAVLVEPLSVAVHSVRLAGVRPGQRVAFGAKTIVIADINKDKLAFSRSYMDCFTFAPDITSSPPQEASRLKEEANIDGLDIVLECTGAESSAQTGLYALARGGTFVQVGMGMPDLTIPLARMWDKEPVLKVSFRYGSGDYEAALELLASGKVSVKPLISNIVPFRDAPKAWEMTRRGEGIKNLIEGVQD
ncbi:hypothetical protein VUR80DRAFT_4008 [Thermomyces stellatus]